jgi:hypothetical protein
MTKWSPADAAELCRLASVLGLLDRASMERWAAEVLGGPDAPPVLADLATSSKLDLSTLSELLDQIPGEGDRARASRAVLGAIGHELLTANIDERRACALA